MIIRITERKSEIVFRLLEHLVIIYIVVNLYKTPIKRLLSSVIAWTVITLGNF